MPVAQRPGMTPTIAHRAQPRVSPALQPVETRMFLIAAGETRAAEAASLSLFESGHIPVMAEWFAFPLIDLAFTKNQGTVGVNDIVQPISDRLLARCDAVLRIPGVCPRADALVAAARARGLRVYMSLEEALAG
jgi:hypothetical protein